MILVVINYLVGVFGESDYVCDYYAVAVCEYARFRPAFNLKSEILVSEIRN